MKDVKTAAVIAGCHSITIEVCVTLVKSAVNLLVIKLNLPQYRLEKA